MSSRAYVGNLFFSDTEDLLRRLRAKQGAVASVGAVQGESRDRSRRFVWSDRPMSVELEPAVVDQQPARTAGSVWANGMLFGMMAKPRPVWPVWTNGTLFGVMAGQRPALGLIG